MSFHSSLIFYRPTPSPKITAAELSVFLERLEATGILRSAPSRFSGVQASFGRSIDQDDKQKLGIRLSRSGGINRVRMIREKWDLVRESHSAEEQISCADIIDSLKNYRHGLLHRVRRTPYTLYRARCRLGIVAEPIWQTVVVAPENNGRQPMRLDNWSFDIGPVMLPPDPDDERANNIEALQVGWIDLRLGGQGSRGVQTPMQIVARAEAQPAIQAMMRLCREFWPVEPTPVPEEVIAGRQMLGPYWPYTRHDLPWDWYWGFSES